MTDLLLEMLLSNVCLALAFAVLAAALGAYGRRPDLAHLLWLLVLVKLVTPPLVTLPLINMPTLSPTEGVMDTGVGTTLIAGESNASASRRSPPVDLGPPALGSSKTKRMVIHVTPWLLALWLIGSLAVLLGSSFRVWRFNRLLKMESEPASPDLRSEAKRIATGLGLGTLPTILTTSAHLSPMVWWTGGQVRVVLPKALLAGLSIEQWQWILAHELAHCRRRDYLVRWLEWLVCVIFWWNPLVWWAQRNLRVMEEICCDDLVMASLKPKPKQYANTLLSAVEFLTRPVLRPPALASAIDSGGVLERRFKMIMSHGPKRSNSGWWRIGVLACAVALLPLGLVSAQDYEAVAKRLKKSVKKGELTQQQADGMIEALKEMGERQSRRQRGPTGNDRRSLRSRAGHKEVGNDGSPVRNRRDHDDERQEAESRRHHDAAQEVHERREAERRRMLNRRGTPESNTSVEAVRERREAERRRMLRRTHSNQERAWAGVEREIEAGVKAGRLTREEANAKFRAMREKMAEQQRHKAVEEGEMSKEEARERLNEARRRTASSHRDSRGDFARAERALREAIADGRISEAQARERLEGMQKVMAERIERRRIEEGRAAKFRDIEARLDASVESGELTEEEARHKLEDVKKELFVDGRLGNTRESQRREKEVHADLQTLERRLKAAIHAGELTEEEAKAKWEAMQKEAQQQAKAKGRAREQETALKRLKAAVDSGEMTKKEAQAKLKAMKRDAQAQKKVESKKKADERKHLQAVKKELEAAVKAGKLSKEEAREKLKAIQKEASRDKKKE